MIIYDQLKEEQGSRLNILGQMKINRATKFKAKKDFPLLDKALHWENCWMGLIVEFC